MPPTKLNLQPAPESQQENSHYMILVIGGVGSGKSTFATTATKPIHFLDLDRKFDQLSPSIDNTDITYQTFDPTLYGDFRILANFSQSREVVNTGFRQTKPAAFTQVADVVNEIYDMQENGEPIPFHTLVIDTYTRLHEHIIAGAKKHATDGFQLWDIVRSIATDFILALTGLSCNVIVCVHEDVQRNSAGDIVGHSSDIQGSMARRIGGYFQEVYYMLPETDAAGNMQVEVRTRADRLYDARSSRVDIPRAPADLQRILRGEFQGKAGRNYQDTQLLLKKKRGG